MTALHLAFGFLTRLPSGVPADDGAKLPSGNVNGMATRYFPLVGAALALLMFGALFAGSWAFDRETGCILAVAALALATGALHLDGLADCVDALGVSGPAARRLQVMHDPRAGALGAGALALWLLLKVALLQRTVAEGTVAQAVWCALIAARAPLAFELCEGEPATPGQGLFAWLHGEVRRADWLISLTLGVALLVPALAPLGEIFVRAVMGLIAGTVATTLWHLAWYRRVGGLTGDVVGAAVEIREMAMFAAMGVSFL